uniref:Uncharacterized protein n=1 Tax=Rhizophora mucronata TaxID=61149 RepID=A0A2P2LFJ4_RHIMU
MCQNFVTCSKIYGQKPRQIAHENVAQHPTFQLDLGVNAFPSFLQAAHVWVHLLQ